MRPVASACTRHAPTGRFLRPPGQSSRRVLSFRELAAAIAGHADCLVTFNLRDFPIEVLGPLGIEVLHPDSFLVAQLDLDTLRVLPAFKKMRARLRNPAFTPEAFADAIERNGLPQTASLLRDAAELI